MATAALKSCIDFDQHFLTHQNKYVYRSELTNMTGLQQYNKHIFYFTMYYCTGFSLLGKKKMYIADLKYSNHSNYYGQKKKSLSKWSFFFFFFLQTSKISINRHSYLVTTHASYSKTLQQSPIQYKVDVSLEGRESQKDLNK